MLSEVMDVPEDASRQVGFWTKSNGKESLGSSSSLENFRTLKSLDAKVRPGFNRQAVGAERTLSHSLNLSRTVSLESIAKSNVNVEALSYYGEGGRGNMMGMQYESSLFSSSLSDFFCVNLSLSSNNAQHGHSIDSVASNYEEEEVFESLEEMEAQTIGNLLPSDDELLSGVTDGLEYNVPLTASDSEELDIFSSSGGMELGDDGLSNGLQCNGSVNGEHPHGEHPSRTLFVRNIISNIEDAELRTLFEQYGDIRTLYTSCKHRGFVMISYYDIRAAWNAMKALQNKPLRRRKLDIHYSIPKDNASEKDVNQGTVVTFSLDSSVSDDELRELLGVYGVIKEIREIPNRMHHKFIEFYDVRAAETALNALNKSDIAGKKIKLEPCRPGCGLYLQQSGPPTKAVTGFSVPSIENMYHYGISSSVPNNLLSMMRAESAVSQSGITESIHAASPLNYDIHGSPAFHPHSLPEYHNASPACANCNSTGGVSGSTNVRQPDRIDHRQVPRVSSGHSLELNDTAFGSPCNVNCPNPGQHYAWNNSFQPRSQGMMWPNSPSYGYGISAAPPPHRMHGLPRAPSHMFNPALSVINHHAGSAPGPNSIWDPRQTYAGGSPEACGFHPGSLGNMRMPNSSPHSMDFVSHNMYPDVNGNAMDMSVPHKSVGFQTHHQRCMMYPRRSQMYPVMNSFEQPTERPRNRRNDGSANQGDNKKQYELDIDRIMRGDDTRTTLMIKNIPNKYNSKMLLTAIDERHRGTYDFIYLPIDFKNKCNVGYAFINMIDPRQIIPFYQSFNGKKWEKFNSEKVASIAYARIQGKYALIAHFQNSSLKNEDKRCRPIIFNTDGPNAGDQVPFPMGVNVRTRPGKSRATSNEENNGGSPPNSGDAERSWNGGSSVGSKDSD